MRARLHRSLVRIEQTKTSENKRDANEMQARSSYSIRLANVNAVENNVNAVEK
jgi:hypothetical protein